MSWVTIIWAMIASAYLMLALVHVLVWCRRPEARGNLLFSLSAVAPAVFAGCELWMMRGEIISLRASVSWVKRSLSPRGFPAPGSLKKVVFE